LRRLGVLLVASPASEFEVEAFRGTRHTSARRYSYDDPSAVVVVVSEQGPVTVLRAGRIIGRSPVTAEPAPAREPDVGNVLTGHPGVAARDDRLGGH
jgi:hypothetical protein